MTVPNEICEKCGNPLKEEWNFCPFCKHQPATSYCTNCLRKVKLRWQYCPFCRAHINGNRTVTAINSEANAWLRTVLQPSITNRVEGGD